MPRMPLLRDAVTPLSLPPFYHAACFAAAMLRRYDAMSAAPRCCEARYGVDISALLCRAMPPLARATHDNIYMPYCLLRRCLLIAVFAPLAAVTLDDDYADAMPPLINRRHERAALCLAYSRRCTACHAPVILDDDVISRVKIMINVIEITIGEKQRRASAHIDAR